MIDHPNPKVAAMGREIGAYLAEIATMFKPGAKLTLLVRHPSHPGGERNMVITDDDYHSIITAIQQRYPEETASDCGAMNTNTPE